MKIHSGFISNSSSTSFWITNISNETKTLVDFVKETPHIVEDFIKEYDWHIAEEYNQDALLQDAEALNIKFKPGQRKACVFGDEDGTLIGDVYDYMLRYGGKSESFVWEFKEFLR